MSEPAAPDTDALLDRVRRGDDQARQQLLGRHRQRLRRMIAVRLDRRLAARVDPSDVVQETLAEADGRLAKYLQHRAIPFYPWLRQIAAERLAKLHRSHLEAARRSARREEPSLANATYESWWPLAARLAASGTSPSEQYARMERRQQLHAALAQLNERDREVLVLRYLEQLSTRETAAVLCISEGAVKLRHLRALERLRDLLGDVEEGMA
jgi:RNA polymerase sigma-70 factor (ECF subfamily)